VQRCSVGQGRGNEKAAGLLKNGESGTGAREAPAHGEFAACRSRASRAARCMSIKFRRRRCGVVITFAAGSRSSERHAANPSCRVFFFFFPRYVVWWGMQQARGRRVQSKQSFAREEVLRRKYVGWLNRRRRAGAQRASAERRQGRAASVRE